MGFGLFICARRQVVLTEKGQDLAKSIAIFLADLHEKVGALLTDLNRFPLVYGESTETWMQLLRENRVLKGDDLSRGDSDAAVLAGGAGRAGRQHRVVHGDLPGHPE